MMGRQTRGQEQLFYEFSLDGVVPADHLVRRIEACCNEAYFKEGSELRNVKKIVSDRGQRLS